VAEALRKTWQLGDAPLESVTQCIEDHGGIVVGLYEEGVKFDGLCGRADHSFPVIVANTAVPDDRRRYDLSHELGHLMMECGDLDAREQEQLAHRFAASFIVPAGVARGELGAQRRSLQWDELALLKQKYGLSMQAWARRAADLSIISQSYYRTLCMQFNARGWKRKEPVAFACHEEPFKLKQMTLRAFAEGIITGDRAEEIFPGCTSGTTAAAESRRPAPRSARDLLSLPRRERERILKVAAAGAEQAYRTEPELTEFEAFGEKDLYG
jgi:Zn-dependent peptidase ImmA (M78 family)